MAEYTPTTVKVRTEYMWGRGDDGRGPGWGVDGLVAGPKFDRWLEAHDRQVAAEALEGAADDIRARGDVGGEDGPTIERYLTSRARIIRATPPVTESEATRG